MVIRLLKEWSFGRHHPRALTSPQTVQPVAQIMGYELPVVKFFFFAAVVQLPELKEKRIAPLGQVSTQEPQRMQAEVSSLPAFTRSATSMLMGHSRLHLPHAAQRSGSAARRSEGHANVLRIFRPITMKGAIQQTAWQPALLPTVTARTKNSTPAET
jgi:hypothetical protein